MSSSKVRQHHHPKLETLALYAGGELGLWKRLGTRRHLDSCVECRTGIELFRGSAATLRQEALRLPPAAELGGRTWASLEQEMMANIHLGVVAGQIVEPAPRRNGTLMPHWQFAGVLAATLLVAAGMLLPHHTATPGAKDHPAASLGSRDRVRERSGLGTPDVATADSAAVSPRILSQLLTDAAAQRAKPESDKFYTSSPDSLRVRYVDAETGQVTINHVYAE